MHTPCILIVDDEASLRWTVRERLEHDGYIVFEAGLAAAAIERAPDVELILLDFTLPDADGLAAVRQIVSHAPDTLVVVMMPPSHGEAAIQATKQGAYYWIAKPLNLDELSVLVNRVLETSRLRREVRLLKPTES